MSAWRDCPTETAARGPTGLRGGGGNHVAQSTWRRRRKAFPLDELIGQLDADIAVAGLLSRPDEQVDRCRRHFRIGLAHRAELGPSHPGNGRVCEPDDRQGGGHGNIVSYGDDRRGRLHHAFRVRPRMATTDAASAISSLLAKIAVGGSLSPRIASAAMRPVRNVKSPCSTRFGGIDMPAAAMASQNPSQRRTVALCVGLPLMKPISR